jgi:flagellar protein FlbB
MTRPTIQNNKIEDVKSPGIFQKLFFWFLIPILFVVAVLLVIASFTNTNVFEKAKEITDTLPFVSSQEEAPHSMPIDSQKVVELQAEIEEKEAQIEQLQSQLESANAKNQEALILQEELEYEIQKLKNEQVVSKQEFTEIISAFEKMSAKEAAPIFVEMNENEAIKILSQLKATTLSEILSKMNPADAARFTERLAQ